MKKQEYMNIVGRREKRSSCLSRFLRAFLFGGLICCLGQGLTDIYIALGQQEDKARILTTITLIFLASLFTGIGWYDKFANVACAGSLVPITGFSNAVTAPAIDAKTEGFVMGVGAKLFVISGPVIVYGTIASILYGLVYYFVLM